MALDPEDARNIPDELIALYTAAELALLTAMAHAIAKGIDTDDWLTIQTEQQLLFRQHAEQLARHLQLQMPKALEQTVQDAATLGEDAADADADEPGTRRTPAPATVGAAGAVGAPAARQRNTARTVAQTQQAWSTLARVTQALPANADALYSQVVTEVQVRNREIPRPGKPTGGILGAPTATGTRLDAAQQALDILTQRGITGFRDSRGRNWSLASYVEMLSRTVVNDAMREAHIERALEHGHTLMVVSSHSNPAPQCQPFEGQILSLDGSTGTVTLESATTGRPIRVKVKATLSEAKSRGLFHPNCGHAISRYVPGASKTYTTKPDPEGYAATQKQRAMERAIRATRTKQAVAITPQAKREVNARLRAQRAAIQAHVDKHGLTRRPRREQINRAR